MKKNKITSSQNKSIPIRLVALLLLFWLAINLLALPVGAAEKSLESSQASIASASAQPGENGVAERSAKLEYTLPGIPSRYISAYKQLNLIVGGKTLNQPAVIVNDITYLPFRAFFDAIGGAKVVYNSSTKTISAAMNGLYIYVSDGGYVTYANDRVLFSFSPAILMNNGRMYVPMSALLKATGLTRNYQSGSELSVGGTYKPLVHASSYYRSDEVLWLGKIISAESRGEPLIGQIAVGNVIMNRVRSNLYPNTIWGVIFDTRYGVQFSPVANGTIYQSPSYTSTLAAKICLEGTKLSEDVLFFVAPKEAPNSWIARTREYAYTICNHDFYK